MNEREIFAAAAEIDDPAARASFLHQACGTDKELRQRIEALLGERDQLGSFLEHAPTLCETIELPHKEQQGTQIGPYKLLQQIGEGGMGTVYMAEQTEPVRRRVALKIIKPGMDSRQVIARFEAERQALAMMDHPNIARVLDAGTTESGRPYFVMELVKGVPLTQYCDEERLTPRERLELFVPICQAVQHAHQKGIIHRDIKPSNILVARYDDRPVPKIIDFGVAKATSQTLTARTMFTQLGQVVGTLEYMSPEQAHLNQLDVDTRSDIYSLGVVLYELLTGETPFDKQRLRSAAFQELLRIIREEEPPKPSTRVSSSQSLPSIAASRHVEPQKLGSVIRGELDWIVMKAIEKERSRRYETASKLAEDIQHYLEDQPVVACPPSAGYRFRKFARRNRGVLTAASLVAAALVVGSVLSTWQAIRATRAATAERRAREVAIAAQQREAEQHRAADEARAAAEQALVNAEQEHQRAETALKRATDEQQRAEGNLDLALQGLDAVYLDAIGTEKLLGPPGSSPDQAEQAGGLQRAELSEFEKSLLRRGLTFYDEFAKRNLETPRASAQTARAYYRVAMLQGGLDEREEAEASFRESIRRYGALIRNEPKYHEYRHELGKCYLGLAIIQPTWESAKQNYALAEEAISAAIEIKPDEAEYYGSRSTVRYNTNDYRHSFEDAEKAIELDPDNVPFRLRAAQWYTDSPFQYKDPRRAVVHGERAVELEPENATAHCILGRAFFYLDGERCLQHLSRAIELDATQATAYATRARIYFNMTDYAHALSDATAAVRLGSRGGRVWRARILCAMRRFDEARDDLAEAESLLHRGEKGYAWLLEARGELHRAMQDWERAEEDYTLALDISPLTNNYYCDRALARFHRSRYEEALQDIKTSLQLAPRSTWALFPIGGQLVADCPDAGFRDALLALAAEPMKSSRSADEWSMYADLLTACGHFDEANVAFRKAFQLGLRDAATHYSDGSYLPLYRFALLLARQEDQAGLRQACVQLLNRFGDTEDPSIAFYVAWTCSVAPRAVGSYDLPVKLAEKAVQKQQDLPRYVRTFGAALNYAAHLLGTLGASLFRSGRYEEALIQLQESDRMISKAGVDSDHWAQTTRYFIAMTHHALGHADQASFLLQQANEEADRVLSNEERPPAWNTRLTLELLRREASGLITPNGAESQPEKDTKP